MQYKHLLATKNYTSGQFDDFDKITGETLAEEYLVKNKGCITCPIRCARVVKSHDKIVKGPEVETITLLGSNLDNSDMQNIIDANYLCDEYGIDTITFGSTLGFAMELAEKGMWDNGLKFGNTQDFEKLVKMVSTRDGIGDELADGTRKLAQKYGGQDFAMNSKGLEFAAYEPRHAQGMGLGYATSNRGGCHLNGGYMVVLEGLGLNLDGGTTKGKAAFSIFFQNLMEALSAGGSCLFTSYAILPGFLLKNPNAFVPRMVNKVAPHVGWLIAFVDAHPRLLCVNVPALIPHSYLIKQATGINMDIGRYVQVGERGYNIERMVNIRFGLTAAEDKLPKRLTHELEDKSNPDSVVKLDAMKKQYYKIRGWGKDGVPTTRTLRRLGIK